MRGCLGCLQGPIQLSIPPILCLSASCKFLLCSDEVHQRSWLSKELVSLVTLLLLHRCSSLKLITSCGYRELAVRPSVLECQTILLNLKSSVLLYFKVFVMHIFKLIFTVHLPKFPSLQLPHDQSSCDPTSISVLIMPGLHVWSLRLDYINSSSLELNRNLPQTS